MILTGWIRLVIILSILWLCVSGYFVYDAYQHHDKEYESNLALPKPPSGYVIISKYKSIFYDWQPVDLLAEGKISYVRSYKANYKNIISFVAYPVIAIWLLYYSITWVASGFKQNSTKNANK